MDHYYSQAPASLPSVLQDDANDGSLLHKDSFQLAVSETKKRLHDVRTYIGITARGYVM